MVVGRRVLFVLALVTCCVPRGATAAPDWTTPIVLPFTTAPVSGFADGGVEFAVRTDVTMPIDFDNVTTTLVVSRRSPGSDWVDEISIASTPSAVPLGGAIAVAPNGAVVVAFSEGSGNDFSPTYPPFRWRAMYRSATGTWESPSTLFTDLVGTPASLSVSALCAIAPDGTAVAGAQRFEPNDQPSEPAPGQTDRQLDMAIRPVGGLWQASQQLSAHNQSVELTPALAADAAGNFTIAWASRFSEGATNGSNDDRHTLLVRRRLAGQTLWNSAEDVTGSDIAKDAFFIGDRGFSMGSDGRAVVAFQYGPGYHLWAASRVDSAHTFSVPVEVIQTGSTSLPLGGAIAPDGTAYLLYGHQGSNSGLDNVGMVKQPPGNSWTSEHPVSPLGFDGSFGGVALDGNDAIAVWQATDAGTYLVQATRWVAGAGTPEAFRDLQNPPSYVSVDDVVSDRAGSVLATWSTSSEVYRAAWDHGGPSLVAATVPNPPIAGVAGSFSATFVDLWSSVAGEPTWDFKDGTPAATGSPVDHTFAAAGGFDVTVTSTDSLGNQSVNVLSKSVVECESLGGTSGLGCRCAVGIEIAACAGQTLPSALSKGFTKGCAAVAVATAPNPGKKGTRAAGRAAGAFKKGDKLLGSKKGKKLPASCHDALAAIFSAARDVATALKGSL